MFLSSLIGDSIILVATIKYRAIKQQKVIVAVIQHLAVSDLLQTVFRIFPIAVAIAADKWVLGDVLCHTQDFVTWAIGGVTMVLTCAMSSLKLAHVKYPFLTRTWSQKFGHKVCAAVWTFILVSYAPVLVVKIGLIRDTIYFDYNNYECRYTNRSINAPSWYLYYHIITFFMSSVLSYLILIVTSILLLLAAKAVRSRNGGAVRLEGLITVLLTVGIYLISFMPKMLVYNGSQMEFNFAPWIWKTISFVFYLNVTANFYIYCITIKSFRKFLKMKVLQVISFVNFLQNSDIDSSRS